MIAERKINNPVPLRQLRFRLTVLLDQHIELMTDDDSLAAFAERKRSLKEISDLTKEIKLRWRSPIF